MHKCREHIVTRKKYDKAVAAVAVCRNRSPALASRAAHFMSNSVNQLSKHLPSLAIIDSLL